MYYCKIIIDNKKKLNPLTGIVWKIISSMKYTLINYGEDIKNIKTNGNQINTISKVNLISNKYLIYHLDPYREKEPSLLISTYNIDKPTTILLYLYLLLLKY